MRADTVHNCMNCLIFGLFAKSAEAYFNQTVKDEAYFIQMDAVVLNPGLDAGPVWSRRGVKPGQPHRQSRERKEALRRARLAVKLGVWAGRSRRAVREGSRVCGRRSRLSGRGQRA